jgi:hypothetical protein
MDSLKQFFNTYLDKLQNGVSYYTIKNINDYPHFIDGTILRFTGDGFYSYGMSLLCGLDEKYKVYIYDEDSHKCLPNLYVYENVDKINEHKKILLEVLKERNIPYEEVYWNYQVVWRKNNNKN